ncbi:NAD(P)/FAD-dependent oxidoreductase [Streptomyces sp. NL15-2K]|uniref:NAD(P)/FAD-dependent oxidoreductase n=1 Tax=Streptomyces sp. NL15-2K TaxID=376149 RepID=UPI000F568560|nr:MULTISPECIES: NAD(P)/FAD-dependent oxidoreductase [Actinomycetes]WKX10320.1 NAD(P)/FAD-dependent oxidoreductase [Kutzneria buriramensis]GCB48181.1 hydroxylase [Streptomyces sp. NL15-2K]
MSGYDVVVVGARCAGAATALLLSRKGYRVLLVDRARFPSDTVCTLHIRQTGVAALARWGLLDDLDATGCPPLEWTVVEAAGVRVEGCSPPLDGIRASRAPRRMVLDNLLATAAQAAGATFWDGCVVEDVLWEDDRVAGVRCRAPGGGTMVIHAPLVIGADGVRSAVSRYVKAETLLEHPTMTCVYYAFWSGLEMGRELYSWEGGGISVLPTNDGLTLVTVTYPISVFDQVRRNAFESYLDTIRTRTPGLYERMSQGKVEERLYAMAHQPNFVRQAAGPGWALVGDAGVHRDAATGHGMSAAFAQAEMLAGHLDGDLADHARTSAALRRFGEQRDAMMIPEYHATRQVATLTVPPRLKGLLELIKDDQELTDAWLGGSAGVVTREQFRELLYSRHPAAR